MLLLRWPSRRPFYYLRPHAEVAIRHRRSHWGDRDTDEYGSDTHTTTSDVPGLNSGLSRRADSSH